MKGGRRTRLPYPRWVPREARQAIEALWVDAATNGNDRVVLLRFATHPSMYDVWEKLPREPKSFAGDLIECAMIAIVAFPTLRPAPQIGRREAWERWDQYRRTHPLGLSDAFHAWSAAELSAAIRSMPGDPWSRHWQGDPHLDRAHVISILDAIARTYQSMEAEREALITAWQFPPVPHWDDPRAAEVFFSRWISHLLEAFFGDPFDDAVAALTAVAFNRVDVGAEAVRWRRRTTGANKQKTARTLRDSEEEKADHNERQTQLGGARVRRRRTGRSLD